MNDVGEQIYNLLLDCGIKNENPRFGRYHGFDGMESLFYEIFWMLEEIYGDDEE